MKEKEKKSEGESNITVAIRIRPLNSKQATVGDRDIVRTQDNLIIILDPVEKQFEMENKKMLDVLHRSKEQRYAFDKIYRDQPSQLIYQQTAKSLIKTVVSGKNATVFAYGPTGTGKTYTMLGNQQVYGLNVLAIRDIFSLIQEDNDFDYSVNITYVEIYNEMIRDLLVPTSGYLQLRDDNDKGITIAGVTEFKAQSTEQVMNLLIMGNKRRTTEATNANQTSSRSHAVFQINVVKVPRIKGTSIETLTGKLSLIDLAGSQRGTVTENRGIRLMEGAKINRSLLALANCINALGDKNKKGFFVPYRDSKLTRLLKDSLGGNCKTVMIVNVSPASSQFEETINTLKYANRAKNIKTKALTNKKLVAIHISEYKNIINDLRQQIDSLKMRLEKNSGATGPENIDTQSFIEANGNVVTPSPQCTCGKMEESQEIKRIKQQIFENFNDRIQLRRALMEIEEQNSANIIEIRKKQNEILLLRKAQANLVTEGDPKAAEEIQLLSRTIQTLKLNTQKNLLKKEITNLQLMESMAATKKIREQIPRKIKSKDNREFLEIVVKNHILELQNIELEINLQLQEKILNNLKNISDSQARVIGERGIEIGIPDQQPENDDIQLELEDDQENDLPDEGPDNIAENEEEYDQDFQQQLQNELMIDRKMIKKNRQAKQEGTVKPNDPDEDKNLKQKVKVIDQNSNDLQLGVVGVNNIKKRQKTQADVKPNPNTNKNAGTSQNAPSTLKQQTGGSDSLLDLNLKGVNLKLNEKLPFVMAPKDKKKR